MAIENNNNKHSKHLEKKILLGSPEIKMLCKILLRLHMDFPAGYWKDTQFFSGLFATGREIPSKFYQADIHHSVALQIHLIQSSGMQS